MRKTLYLLLTAVLLACGMAHGAEFNNEDLHYVISYKWGLIHKDAGDATLSLRRNGANYNLKLTAKTKPWADRIYKVRDTLLGTVRRVDLRPISYSKITHEKGKYDRDDIKFSTYRTVTKGNVVRSKLRDGVMKRTEKTLTGSGPVFDMLSVFYYLRHLDYSKLQAHHIYKATIFSGSKSEYIKIRSLGKERIKLKNKTEREAYHIKFNFTQEGGRKSSDDIDTWISTDDAHIPLYLVGKLPIGEVRVNYVN